VLRRSYVVGVSAAATLVLAAGLATASHDPDVTDDEVKCQVGTSLASKFVTEKAKCLIKCGQGHARASTRRPTACRHMPERR
jgi:hypothetical protein